MSNKMKPQEAVTLLNTLRSQRRVLLFQLNALRPTIKGLRQKLKQALVEERKAGGLKGTAGASRSKPPQKRGRPGRPRRPQGVGPKLNKWDNAVLASLSKTDRLMHKREIVDAVSKAARASLRGRQQDRLLGSVETMVTRSLQKLSKGDGRRLGFYRSGLMRGGHYGLSAWFFGTTGRLRPAGLERLVLERK